MNTMNKKTQLNQTLVSAFLNDVAVINKPYIYVVSHYAEHLSLLLSHKNIAMIVVQAQPIYLQLLKTEFKNDQDIVEVALNFQKLKEIKDDLTPKRGEFLKGEPDRTSEEFKTLSIKVAELMTAYEKQKQKSTTAFEFIGDKSKANKELLLKYIEHLPAILRYTTKELKNDPEIVLKATKYGHVGVIEEAGSYLNNDLDFLKELVTINSECLFHFKKTWKQTPELLKIALDHSKHPAWFAARLYSHLKNDDYLPTIIDSLLNKSITLIPRMIAETGSMDSIPSLKFDDFMDALNTKKEHYFIKALKDINSLESFSMLDASYYVVSRLGKKDLEGFVSTHKELNEIIVDRLHRIAVEGIKKEYSGKQPAKQRKILK